MVYTTKERNYVDTSEKSPAVLSLCTGLMRGLERGVEAALQTPVRTVVYVEIEAVIVENLIAGMEAGILDPAPIWTNLKTFPYREFHGKIHGITGGYPCQPFSTAGKRGGAKDPRHLWPHILRIVQSVKPVWCFFENVEGHLSLGFEEVSRDLRKMGYRVEADLFSAEEIGAPQQRKRLFILAILGDTQSNHQWNDLVNARYREFKVRGTSEGSKLGHPNSNGYQKEYVFRGCRIDKGQNKREENKWQWIRTEPLSTSKEKLANCYYKGLQRRECRELQECSGECTARTSSAWPARPGEPQYTWEHERTIESGVGCTVNGYNFREDILRGLGNGVVWQTAELAFRTLMYKHRKEC